MTKKSKNFTEWSEKSTIWIGSRASLIVHTFIFAGFFLLGILGFPWDSLLLVLTTVVSLEAIYLAIFIQMSVNRNTESLAEVEENIDEIQEDIDEIQEDVDEIQEDVGEIQEDVGEIHEEVDELGDDIEDRPKEKEASLALEKIQSTLEKLSSDIDALKKELDRS